MILQSTATRNPRMLLNGFIYGSLLVLLICLGTTALVFSYTYLQKQEVRIERSKELISDFFDFQYRAITEEMWTKNYEAIHMRVAEIARQLNHATYDLILADEKGDCVLSIQNQNEDTSESARSVSNCSVPEALKQQIPKFRPELLQPVLQIQKGTDRFVYMTPLYVGSVLKGYLYSTMVDPYGFYRENSLILVMRIFMVPILCILLVWCLWLVASQRFILRPYFSAFVQMKKKEAVGELAGQVAHNIRSPLVVLNSVVKNIQGIDETQKKLLTTAAARIESIASDLITHFRVDDGVPEKELFTYLTPIIDAVIAEKSVVLGTKSKIEILSNIDSSAYSEGVSLSPTDLSVVLSNLINNAMEAFSNSESQSRNIVVSAWASPQGRVNISVTDNGKGIPADVLKMLSLGGGTFGKIGGAGIGLSHARDTVAKVGGTLRLKSKVGEGTTVTLGLPLAPQPTWCAVQLDLVDAETIIVLDDDPGMRLLWNQRLGEVDSVFVSHPSQFDIVKYPASKCRYIFDHDLGPGQVTGLELIRSYGLGSRAVLVTSHFADKMLQRAADSVGSKVLPKFMVSKVPILRPISSARSVSLYDLILIDDDPMMHELWEFEAQLNGKRFKGVKSLSELNLEILSRDIPVYVDKQLGSGVCGFSVAAHLNELGFSSIYLATGEKVKAPEVPQFIRGVRNKDFPIS